MKLSKPLIIITFILSCLKSTGQDTTWYYQSKAFLYSNHYVFIRKSKSDKYGTFIQRSSTDDGQSWIGKGTFVETKRKFLLNFDTTNQHNRIETASNQSHKDSIYIRCADWLGEEHAIRLLAKYEVINDRDSSHEYYSGDCLKFSKEQFSKITSIYLGLYNEKLDLPLNTEANEIKFFVKLRGTHIINKKREKLRKNKKGFITHGEFENIRHTQFIQYRSK